MTTISMKIRECHKSGVESRECGGDQRNRVGQQKAPTDVVQQGSGAEAGHGTWLEGGFRCAAMRAIWQEAVEQIKVKN